MQKQTRFLLILANIIGFTLLVIIPRSGFGWKILFWAILLFMVLSLRRLVFYRSVGQNLSTLKSKNKAIDENFEKKGGIMGLHGQLINQVAGKYNGTVTKNFGPWDVLVDFKARDNYSVKMNFLVSPSDQIPGLYITLFIYQGETLINREQNRYSVEPSLDAIVAWINSVFNEL